MHLFKVHWHTGMPGARPGQGSWPWASLAPPLGSLIWTTGCRGLSPAAAHAAHLDLALTERRLGPPVTTHGDSLELHNTAGLVPPTPRPCQPGGISSTWTKSLGLQPSCHWFTGHLGRVPASKLLGLLSL